VTALDPYATQKRYRARRHRFGGHLLVDAEPYRLQLQRWRDLGWSYPAIAQAVGVDVSTIQRISGNDTAKLSQWVYRETAQRIDNANFVRVHGGVQVPAMFARRRLQALAAIGWTQAAIIDTSGIPRGTINSALYRSDQITADTHQAIRWIYEPMSASPQDGTSAHRARLNAARNGWAPPAAWDDIDDPDAVPHGIRQAGARDQMRSRYGDAAETIAELADRGDDLQAIMAHLGITKGAVYKALKRGQRLDVWDLLLGRRSAA